MYTVIKFGAKWCGPCKMLGEALSRQPLNIPNVTFEEYDADKDEVIFERYHVQNVPTILILDEEGAEIDRHAGGITRDQLEKWVKEVLHAQ